MTHPPLSKKLAAYAVTAAAMGGSARAAIVHLDIDFVLSDPDTNAINSDKTIGAIKFDGQSVIFAHTGAGGAATFNAIDQLSSTKTPTAATIYANQGYVQTPELLSLGDEIGAAFTQTNTTMYFPAGSGEDLYLGVSTPANQYGWVHFSYTADGKTVTIHDAAFQSDPFTTIKAGEKGAGLVGGVPEPSSAALAGLAGGLLALRRRRAARTSPTLG